MALVWLFYGFTIAKLLCHLSSLLSHLPSLTARTLSRSGGAAFNLDGGSPSLLELFAKAAAERPTVLCLDANSGTQ